MDTRCHKDAPDKDRRNRCMALCSGHMAFIVAVGVLCVWALLTGIKTTWSCQWPAEWDTLRDMGMAQSILDGRYPEDPVLAGETLWYNPLTGALIALSGKISGVSLHRASIVIGPYLNLLAPVGLVVLLALLSGRAAALAGLCVLLFAKDPKTSFWVQACYSPWLLAPLYSLGLFFLMLAAYYRGLVKRSFGWFIVAGVALGVTFMAHTAPALVGGGIMALALVVETIVCVYAIRCRDTNSQEDSDKPPSRNFRTAWVGFVALLAVAFIVSLPFTWSILWNYRFQVHNPFPSLYAADFVSLNRLPERLHEALNWRNALAVAGLLVLVRRCPGDIAARFVLCWTCVALAFVGQHYAWQALLARGIVLTAIVPGHHAAIHLSAVRAALFAIGVSAAGAGLATCAGNLWQRRGGRELSAPTVLLVRKAGAVVAVVFAGGMLYLANPLMTRVDFQPPDAALYHQYHEQGIPMYQWILDNTPPDAMFLCEEESVGMTVVMPAGRKLVAAMLLYSNPYVPPAPLFDTQRGLFNAIEQGDKEGFCAIAQRYPVLYLLTGVESAQAKQEQFSKFFEEAGRAGNLVVWRKRPCVG